MYDYIKKGFRKWCGKKPELCENTTLGDLTSKQIEEIFGDRSLNQQIENEPMGVRVVQVPDYTVEELERMKKIKQRQLQYEEQQRKMLVNNNVRNRLQEYQNEADRRWREKEVQKIGEEQDKRFLRQQMFRTYNGYGKKSRRPKTRKTCKSRNMKWNSSTKRCNKSKK